MAVLIGVCFSTEATGSRIKPCVYSGFSSLYVLMGLILNWTSESQAILGPGTGQVRVRVRD